MVEFPKFAEFSGRNCRVFWGSARAAAGDGDSLTYGGLLDGATWCVWLCGVPGKIHRTFWSVSIGV